MADENAKIDNNYKKTLLGVTDDASAEIKRLLVDPTTGRLKVSAIVTSGGGITSINTLTAAAQTLTVGTSGTDFAISSGTATHTFNLPTASTVNRGALSSADWTTFNNKGAGTVTSVSALTLGTTGTDLSSTVATGTTTPVITLQVPTASAANRGALSSTDWSTFNGKQAGHANLTSLSGLVYASASFVKMTGANTFTLDTNTYLTAVTAHNLLSATHGDTTTGTAVLGGVIYADATAKWVQLAGNTTTAKQYLSQTGTGAASAVPAWATISIADLAAFTSAQLATACSDETGTDKLVYNTSPTLVTPILGTPTSGTLTNCTGLPASGLAVGTLPTGLFLMSENTSLGLDPALSADGKYSGITVTGVAGATVAFGDVITLDKDDSRWELVDISAAAAATGDARGLIGMAVSAGNDGDAITVLLVGNIRADANFPALTIGACVYASTTGDIVVTQPNTADYVIRIIGWATTANDLFFNPDGNWITHT